MLFRSPIITEYNMMGVHTECMLMSIICDCIRVSNLCVFVFQLYCKLHCDDPPMLEHVEQLLGELGGEVEEGEEEEAGAALDQEFEPCSDEEEEEEEEASAMEH